MLEPLGPPESLGPAAMPGPAGASIVNHGAVVVNQCPAVPLMVRPQMRAVPSVRPFWAAVPRMRLTVRPQTVRPQTVRPWAIQRRPDGSWHVDVLRSGVTHTTRPWQGDTT